MSEITDLGELTDSMIENYSAELPLHGMAVIFWHEDNSVSAAYNGEPMAPIQVVDLVLNGGRAMLASIVEQAQKAEEPKNDLSLVTDKGTVDD